MMDLVTVYITNYNYSKFLEQAIVSVYTQTYENIEVIVIDDGSTDSSRELLKRLQTKYGFRLVLQKNLGLNRTNNKIVKLASGRYIIRLDADDWFADNCVEELVCKIKKSEASLVFPDYYEVDSDGRIIRHMQRMNFETPDILLNSPAHGAGTLFDRVALIEVGGYSEKFDRQDGIDIWLKLIEKHKVTNVRKPLFYYRQHGSNLTTDKASLFETRSKIFLENTKDKLREIEVVVIIPVLGVSGKFRDLSLYELGEKTLLEYKVREIKKSKVASKIFVTSSDSLVQEKVKSLSDCFIQFVPRPKGFSESHTSLVPTIKNCLEKFDLLRDDVVILVSTIDYPVIKYFYFDLVCANLLFFGLDSVDTVYREDAIMYSPSEYGLKVVGNTKFIRHEREQLYRRAGGITAYRALCFQDQSFNFLDGRLGHVEIDLISATKVVAESDLMLVSEVLKKEI